MCKVNSKKAVRKEERPPYRGSFSSLRFGPELLERDHNRDEAGATIQVAESLADGRAESLNFIGGFHRITGMRAGHQQVACVDGAERGVHLHSFVRAERDRAQIAV